MFYCQEYRTCSNATSISAKGVQHVHQPDRQWNGNSWRWEKLNRGVTATIENINDSLKIYCSESTELWSPAICYGIFSLRKGKRYCLNIEVKSEGTLLTDRDQGPRLQPKIDTTESNGKKTLWFYECMMRLDTEGKISDSGYKIYEMKFVSQHDSDNVKLSIFRFVPGFTYEIRNVSLREVLQ